MPSPTTATRSDWGQGRYDALYAASRDTPLWPEHPGRMVRLAADHAPSGRAVDIGCGDGKNLLFLERRGWTVDGIDISPAALGLASRRLLDAGHAARGELACADAAACRPARLYDLVVCYGLAHCLHDTEFDRLWTQLGHALRNGGLLAFAAFNDDLPVPHGHATGPLFPRPRRRLLARMRGWREHAVAHGFIAESHPPLVSPHRHSITWALLEKL